MRIRKLFIAAAIGAVVCAHARAGGELPALAEQATPLGRFDPWRFRRAVVGPDGNRAAWQRKAGDQVVMVVDGAAGQPFDSIDDPVFSPDGSRVLYIGHAGDKMALVLDGNAGPLYRSVHDAQFSANSRHVLYVARVGPDAESLVVDGQPRNRYRYIHRPLFSPDSSVIAYDATKGDNEATHVLVRDGTEGPEGGEITDLTFSPDGKHLAAVRHRDGRHQCVLFDGVERKAYQQVASLMFSPDSRRFAHFAQRDDGTVIEVVDGVEGKPYESMWRAGFSPDSRRFVYTVTAKGGLEGGSMIIIDHSELGPFASIGPAVFSADGSRLALNLMRTRGGMTTMWVDGLEQKPFADVQPAVFSPDGKHLAYAVSFVAGRYVANQAIVHDGTVGRAYDGAWDPAFSPDSKHLAYRAFRRGFARDGQRIVLDGADGTIYEEVTRPVFSPDGRHCAYMAQRDRKWFAVVDGRETQGSDAVLEVPEMSGEFDAVRRLPEPRPVFDRPDRFHYLAVRAGELFRVSVSIGG